MPKERQFIGLDAYQKAIDCGVDLVLLCTPPGFRPCISRRRSRPASTSSWKSRWPSMRPASAASWPPTRRPSRRGWPWPWAITCGTKRSTCEVVKRIHDGAIGDVMFLRVYFNCQRHLDPPAQAGPDRNAVPGAQLVLLHLAQRRPHRRAARPRHRRRQLDQQAHPVEAKGMGGRQVRVRPGHRRDLRPPRRRVRVRRRLEDVQLLPPDPRLLGHLLAARPRHQGPCRASRGTAQRAVVDGQKPLQAGNARPTATRSRWTTSSPPCRPASPTTRPIRAAESTMTAILGRMATYSGQMVEWDEALQSNWI